MASAGLRKQISDGISRHARAGLADCCVVIVSYVGVLYARFEGEIPEESVVGLLLAVLPICVLFVAGNMVAGAYRRDWRYASIDDAAALFKPVVVITLLLVTSSLLFSEKRYIPGSVYLLSALPVYVGMVSLRTAPLRLRGRWRSVFLRGKDERERVIVVGSGRLAHDLVGELNRHRRGYVTVGVVSDEPGADKLVVGGTRVIGGIADLKRLVESQGADLVAIALPDAPRTEMRRIIDECLTANVRIRIVPQLRSALDREHRPEDLLRETEVEDFLGRKPVDADPAACRSYIGGRRILITGAAGSIGSELTRQVARLDPGRLVLVDTNESGLFDLVEDLRLDGRDTEVVPFVCNIEDKRSLEAAFHDGVDVIFHAAAYKHVPLMEEQPHQAIATNVLGTRQVVGAAARAGAGRFIFISTDKAVLPSNVMGASKRVGEAVVHGLGRDSQMLTAAVRFGNVLRSRGSVIPTFERQIERGGPVTVTHPDVTRFFMTIPEAVMLVIQAGALTAGHDTFVLRMGEEVRIADLAQKLIRLRGHRVGTDIEIVYTGLRPGEKLSETLTYPDEALQRTAHPDIFRIDGPSACPSAVEQALSALAGVLDESSPSAARTALFTAATALFGSDTSARGAFTGA